MASIIKVDTIKDTSDNTLLTSSSGNVSISNNLGIGTSSPATPLHIVGAEPIIRLTDSDGTASHQIFGNTTDLVIDADRFGDATSNIIFRNDAVEAMRIDSSGNLGIGISSPSFPISVQKTNGSYTDFETVFDGSISGGGGESSLSLSVQGDGLGGYISSNLTFSDNVASKPNTARTSGFIKFGNATSGGSSTISFGGTTTGSTSETERMRIDSSGNLLINRTSTDTTTEGASFSTIGNDFTLRIVNTNSSSGQALILLNRQNSDGGLVTFRHADTTEGSIGVSGATVNYAGFTGTHWSRLSDNSKPTILKGTILESLDEMMDWYQVQFDIIDEEGNTRTEKESYALGDGESVGDVITYNFNTRKQDDEGNDIIEEVQATIIQEDDIKHTKSKISDTVDAKNVYGVFVDWDNDDDTVNDMYVAQTGSYVIRINGSETVSKGDLIQSNGDGTGKVQADDIIRASTVAKVISTTKVETYDDGSYIVPCTLHC